MNRSTFSGGEPGLARERFGPPPLGPAPLSPAPIGLDRVRLPARTRARLGTTALGGLLAASLAMALAAASSPSAEVPASAAGFPGWLSGPLPDAGFGVSSGGFVALLCVMFLCYLAVLAVVRELRARWVLAAIVIAQLLFMVAPPLLSPDVFAYLAYARMDALHGLIPYAHVPLEMPQDAAHAYVRWRAQVDPYGPLFTVATYPLAFAGLAGGLWALKGAMAGAGLALVALVWACARRLGRAPLAPSAFVGLNPILLVHGVGGAHNDLLMTALLVLGVYLILAERELLGAGVAVCAAAVKVAAGPLVVFAIIGARRRASALAGAALAAVAIAALTFAAFGPGAVGLAQALGTQSTKVSSYNLPNALGWALGLGGVTPAIRAVAVGCLLGALCYLLVRTWRGADWITAMGWAALAMLLTTTWLMHWYLIWLLPLAALGSSRILRGAALSLPLLMVAMGFPPVP